MTTPSKTTKTFVGFLIIIAICVCVFLVVRFGFGGDEDTWICVNNQWVKHGKPSAPQPQTGCGVMLTPQ